MTTQTVIAAGLVGLLALGSTSAIAGSHMGPSHGGPAAQAEVIDAKFFKGKFGKARKFRGHRRGRALHKRFSRRGLFHPHGHHGHVSKHHGHVDTHRHGHVVKKKYHPHGKVLKFGPLVIFK